MRRFTFAILAAILAAAVVVAVSATDREAAKKESAVIEFTKTVKLGGVLLRGQYLIVHDEERMAQGEACTYIYRGNKEAPGNLVSSFHCIHMDRAKTEKLKISYSNYGKAYEVPEIVEIQFAGSSDGHRVP